MIACIQTLSVNEIFTAISALATAVMAYLTYRSIRNGKEQIEEMKAQWEKENRPYLELFPVAPPFTHKDGSLAIEIKNIGKRTAKDVSIEIEDSFVQGFNNDIVNEQIQAICSNKYRILPNESKILTICSIKTTPDGEVLLGAAVPQRELNSIRKYLSNFKFKVKCSYEDYSFEQILSSNELAYQKIDYLGFLEDMEYDLAGIRSELQRME